MRTDTDQEFEKAPDGSMRELTAVEREVSDLEIAVERAPDTLLALLTKDTWEPQDLADAVVALAHIVLQPRLLQPPSETAPSQPPPP